MEHSGLYEYRILEHSHSESAHEGTPLFLIIWDHGKGAKIRMRAYAPCHLAHTLIKNQDWASDVFEFLGELSTHLQDVSQTSRDYFVSLSEKTWGVRSLVCGSCIGADLTTVVESFFMVSWPKGFQRQADQLVTVKPKRLTAARKPRRLLISDIRRALA